jgi:hypothetical protein
MTPKPNENAAMVKMTITETLDEKRTVSRHKISFPLDGAF